MMNMKMPQTSSQEIVGAQMNGVSFFGMKGVLLVFMVVMTVITLTQSYASEWRKANQSEDYRILGCEVEELEKYYQLEIQVESLNGHEQTVEIYLENGDWLQRENMNELYYLPAYETATVTYQVSKKQVEGDAIVLQLKTYEPQTWTVQLP